jgi:hypothetical protein
MLLLLLLLVVTLYLVPSLLMVVVEAVKIAQELRQRLVVLVVAVAVPTQTKRVVQATHPILLLPKEIMVEMVITLLGLAAVGLVLLVQV